ncbi:MAG: hypothetical protein ACK4ZJ_17140 [Allorhizobium sp.]
MASATSTASGRRSEVRAASDGTGAMVDGVTCCCCCCCCCCRCCRCRRPLRRREAGGLCVCSASAASACACTSSPSGASWRNSSSAGVRHA